jgi:hypothetical protein
MKAIAGISSKHLTLLDEYRMALSLWSETRALYSPKLPKLCKRQNTLRILSTSCHCVTCRSSLNTPPNQATQPCSLLPPYNIGAILE